MEQNSDVTEKRGRGRPRAYDSDAALARAGAVFWKTGYAGTSLDEISAATGMNRPSLRAAFGDKRSLYLKVLHSYWDQKFVAMRRALGAPTLRQALNDAYAAALATYFSGDAGARGCFVVGTAITEAVEDPEIAQIATAGFDRLDADFAQRLRQAQAEGELAPEAHITTLAFLTTAAMQSIAIRARSGTPRATLQAMAEDAVALICGRT
jgi:TetR/AcrR family transcriptional regulator, copper-responsive repressor